MVLSVVCVFIFSYEEYFINCIVVLENICLYTLLVFRLVLKKHYFLSSVYVPMEIG